MRDTMLSIAGKLHVPLMPLSDVEGNEGTAAPAQIDKEVPKLNVGVMFCPTVTVKVVLTAHRPAAGVKVYTPDAWSFTTAGLHVPAMPLPDAEGNAGTVPPVQMASEVPKLNVGVVFGVIVTEKAAVVAHNPAVGVKVYVPDVWLSTTAGLHVPVIPFVEVVGNTGAVAPLQMIAAVPKLNAGVILALTFTLNVTGNAHKPAAGVKV